MPIRPENRDRYPANWLEIRAHILARAGNRCEWCGVENHKIGYRNEAGDFIELGNYVVSAIGDIDLSDLDARQIDGHTVLRIVLTIAHVHDPAPENCAEGNLAALCQRCHLNHDRDHHAQTRSENIRLKERAAGQLDLFAVAAAEVEASNDA